MLHRARNIPVSCTVLSVRGAEDVQGVGRGQNQAADLNWIKKDSITVRHYVKKKKKNHEKHLGVAWGNSHCLQTGRSSVGG